MNGVDTNILARYYVQGDGDREAARQHPIAVRIIGKTPRLFVPKTVVLELEWVLRGFYEFTRTEILKVFDHLLALPNVTVEDEAVVERAVSHYRAGLDFADALHQASSTRCDEFLTFDDRGFARKANRLATEPKVTLAL